MTVALKITYPLKICKGNQHFFQLNTMAFSQIPGIHAEGIFYSLYIRPQRPTKITTLPYAERVSWWNKAICLSSRNPEVYFSLESVVLNKNKYLLVKDNIQRHLPYLQIKYIQYDTFRTNPDLAAAYVIAFAVVHNIGIQRRDIMYNIPDVNATTYNPANNYVAVTCRNIAQKYFGNRDMYMQQLSDMHLVMMKL